MRAEVYWLAHAAAGWHGGGAARGLARRGVCVRGTQMLPPGPCHQPHRRCGCGDSDGAGDGDGDGGGMSKEENAIAPVAALGAGVTQKTWLSDEGGRSGSAEEGLPLPTRLEWLARRSRT